MHNMQGFVPSSYPTNDAGRSALGSGALAPDTPIDLRIRLAEEALKVMLLLDSGETTLRRAKEREVAVPVRRPKKSLIGCEHILATA